MKDSRKIPVIGDGTWAAVVPFALITFCFALWGFANDVTTPLVKSFSKIFRMSVTEGTLVQVAFYGGYFAMAFPAAMFIRRYSYKAGVMLGLGLYALGAFLFFPAKMTGDYYPFLIAYFILTCGLSFLETSCNPYILSMGAEETATRRLNLAQAFNPMGALLGMYVAMEFIQRRLHPLDTAGRALLSGSEFEAVRDADLETLIAPYLVVGLVTLSMLVLVRLVRMPRHRDTSGKIDFLPTLKRLVAVRRYREGVVAQFFYVGAQIMCWTFIIQYGTRLFMSMGMAEQAAEVRSQQFNIAAMAVFCVSRFICTFLLRFFNSGLLLRTLAVFAALFTVGVMFLQNIWGMYCIVGVSACMSLMFPTIYGIALQGLGEECQVRGRRADYGHPWRFNIATGSGGYHRPAHALGDAGGKLVFRFAIHLLCGCGILRSQCLSPWLDIKMFYGLVFMERRLCRRVWPLFSSIFRLHQVLRQGSGGRCPAPRHRALGVRGETGLAVDGRGT